MYKNFNLTDEERKTILEQHKKNGYKTSVNESSMDDNEMDINPDDYKSEPLKMPDNFESYYMFSIFQDGAHPRLLGGDSSETETYANLNWLGRNGYRRTEFHDIDELFSTIDGMYKHFSGEPETAKLTAQRYKELMGNKPFVVWMKDFKRNKPEMMSRSFGKSPSNWSSDKKSMDGKTDRFIDQINKL